MGLPPLGCFIFGIDWAIGGFIVDWGSLRARWLYGFGPDHGQSLIEIPSVLQSRALLTFSPSLVILVAAVSLTSVLGVLQSSVHRW
jgi:hypothetical protein